MFRHLRRICLGLGLIACMVSGSGIATAQTVKGEADTERVAAAETYKEVLASLENWMSERAGKAVERSAEIHDFVYSFSLFADQPKALEFEVSAGQGHEIRKGGVTYACDRKNPADLYGLPEILTAEEKETLCSWRLWQYEYADFDKVMTPYRASQIDFDALDVFLREVGKKPGPGFPKYDVDWSGFVDDRDISSIKHVRFSQWDARTCPALTDMLAALEGRPLGRLDIEGVGVDGARTHAPKGAFGYSVTLFSLVNGHRISVEYKSSADAVTLFMPLGQVMMTCSAK